MVVKRRLLFAITTAATLVLAAAAPMSAAYSAADPDPLRKESLLRVQDIDVVSQSSKYGHPPIAAIGWRESANPPGLFVTFSTTGGKTYTKSSGAMRKARVVGEPKAGLSLDICAGRIWMGTAVATGSATVPSDVVLSSRNVTGSTNARQALVTTSGVARKVRGVDVACVGDKLLAITWLERISGKDRVRLVLRSLELPGATPDFLRKFGLGEARFSGGVSVAATSDSVHVAWAKGTDSNIAYKRYLIGDQASPSVTKTDTRTVGKSAANKPKLAARGNKVALAYVDNGKIKAKVSTNSGASFGGADVVVNTGTKAKPSKVHSIDVAETRVVIGASAYKSGKYVSTRIESTNLGESWSSRAFGNNGARVVTLLKRSDGSSYLREAWHNATSGKDTLRARFEKL